MATVLLVALLGDAGLELVLRQDAVVVGVEAVERRSGRRR
jgi:hypothetical protein